MPRPSALVSALPSDVPFVGPESIERRLNRRFILRLGANESPFGPSPLALEAMRRQAEIAQFYGDPEGWDLRNALAMKFGVRPEQIVLGAGIDELLGLLCRVLADPESPVVTTQGSYPTFEFGALGAGLAIHRVSYHHDAVDLDALTERASELKARIVYLANPDNPSGSVHSASVVERFRHRLPESAYLILDEAYSDFAPKDAVGAMNPEDPSVVRLRTFSKGHGMAGMRVACAVGAERTIRLLDRIRMHFGVSSVAQAGALASLQDDAHLTHVVEETNLGKRRFAEFVGRLGLSALPSATNFITIDIGSKPRADALLEDLIERGIFVRKPWNSPIDRCVRVTIGRRDQMDLLEPIFAEAVGRLKP